MTRYYLHNTRTGQDVHDVTNFPASAMHRFCREFPWCIVVARRSA